MTFEKENQKSLGVLIKDGYPDTVSSFPFTVSFSLNKSIANCNLINCHFNARTHGGTYVGTFNVSPLHGRWSIVFNAVDDRLQVVS